MRILQPKTEIVTQSSGLQGIYEMIEIAGRNCYNSDIKYRYWNLEKTRFLNEGTADFNLLYNPKDFPIKESVTAKAFTDRMINSGHGAMLEHGTVYLTFPLNTLTNNREGFEECYLSECYKNNPYSKINFRDYIYVTTNLRVLVENNWMDDLQYLCEPTEYHEKRVTFKFSTQIAITREFNRHRVNSAAEQSTRYCNYSKDKFDNQISINLPTWIYEDLLDRNLKEASIVEPPLRHYCGLISDQWDELAETSMDVLDYWLFANLACEFSYMKLINLGCTAQQARVVLPLDLNTELVHTAFVSDWKHFLDLRHFDKTGAAHPDAKVLAISVYENLKNNNLW